MSSEQLAAPWHSSHLASSILLPDRAAAFLLRSGSLVVHLRSDAQPVSVARLYRDAHLMPLPTQRVQPV